jgi:hypothetical protein
MRLFFAKNLNGSFALGFDKIQMEEIQLYKLKFPIGEFVKPDNITPELINN